MKHPIAIRILSERVAKLMAEVALLELRGEPESPAAYEFLLNDIDDMKRQIRELHRSINLLRKDD